LIFLKAKVVLSVSVAVSATMQSCGKNYFNNSILSSMERFFFDDLADFFILQPFFNRNLRCFLHFCVNSEVEG
jgi:hypothetical protein